IIKLELPWQTLERRANPMAFHQFPCRNTDHALVGSMQVVLRRMCNNHVGRMQELTGKAVSFVDVVCPEDAITKRPSLRAELAVILQNRGIQNHRTSQYIDVAPILQLQLGQSVQ